MSQSKVGSTKFHLTSASIRTQARAYYADVDGPLSEIASVGLGSIV